jgi:polysaccharide biosynthesis protein PslH
LTVSILWLGRIVPLPLSSGDRVYSANLCKAIARAGAHIVFLGLANPDEPMVDHRDLDATVEWQLVPGPPRPQLLSLLHFLPLVGARFATKAYRKAIAHELAVRNYDAVVFDQYAMGWALPYARRRSPNRLILVHLCHNFETDVTAAIARNFKGNPLRKLVLLQNAWKTRLAEQKLARDCDISVSLTESDRAAFAKLNGDLRTIVLPPGYGGYKRRARTIQDTVPRRAIIVGSFRWIAKQMNLQRFLEAADVLFDRHRIELNVVGIVPAVLENRLKARFPWVNFRGFVQTLDEELDNARVALVPEETGGGFKLKILDYIFSRVPVASIDSALSGIPDPIKAECLEASNLETLAAKVVESIDDLARLNAMQDRAFELAEGAFDWDANARQFLQTLDLVRHELLALDECKTKRAVEAETRDQRLQSLS